MTRSRAFSSPAWTHPLQWMLGRDLFVSPVLVAGETEHEVALPPGAWRDAWTGEAVEGPAVLRREVAIDRAAVYVRAAVWDDLAGVSAD